MISKAELRIGNQFLYKGMVKVVDEIVWNGVRVEMPAKQYFEEYLFEMMEPIILDPDIVSKMGFETHAKDGWYIDYGEYFAFHVVQDGDRFMQSINEGEYWEGVELKYVHQLQNRANSIAGKEVALQLKFLKQ